MSGGYVSYISEVIVIICLNNLDMARIKYGGRNFSFTQEH